MIIGKSQNAMPRGRCKMHIRKLQNDITKDEWNNIISNYESKTLYHTYEWLEFIEEIQGLKKEIYEIVDDNEIVGYLPGFRIKKGPVNIFGSPFPGWTTPYMGPIINNNVSQELFFKEFKNLMKREGYHYAELSNRKLDIDLAKKENFIITEGTTYIAEVKPNPEEILSSYSKSTRKNVRRAIKNNLIVETTKDDSFVDSYYTHLEQVFLKSNMKPTYPKKRAKLLIDKLLPENKIILTWVKFEDKVIANRIDLIDGLWMHAFSTTSNQSYLKLKPNELARFHAMCVAADRGVRHYDMTGGGTYKRMFNSEEITTYRIIYGRFGLYKARNLAKTLIKLKNKLETKLS